MPLASQLQLVMMSKCSKFGVDTFYIILVMGNNDSNDNNDDDIMFTIARLFLRNRRAKTAIYLLLIQAKRSTTSVMSAITNTLPTH